VSIGLEITIIGLFMNNILFVFLLNFLLSPNTFADQIRVYGTITSPGGEPVANARIRFGHLNTISDENGYYELYLQPVSVDEEPEPVPLTLFQNYPNPFNPHTTIPYRINAPRQVSLDIYAVNGQHIRTLVNEYQHQGEYRVVWDGRDNAGYHVAAGIYFYQLRAGAAFLSKKMLLLDGGQHDSTGKSHDPVEKSAACRYQHWLMEAFHEDSAYHVSLVIIDTETREDVLHDVIMEEIDILKFRAEYGEGSFWSLGGLDIAAREVTNINYNISIGDSARFDGEQFWKMAQDWNSALPDTLYVREENKKLYWYINNKKQLVFDTVAEKGSTWTVELTDNGEIITIENMSGLNDLGYSRIYKYSMSNSDDRWCEMYSDEMGMGFVMKKHDQQITSAIVFTHNYVAADYFFETLWDKFESFMYLLEE